jgi:hypothetical protein
MFTTESTVGRTDQNGDRNRDRELVQAITDALVLAAGRRAAHQALRRARAKTDRIAQYRP